MATLKRHPSKVELAERIGSCWLPDETVLYVGLAGQPLRTRVRQYYRTPLGAAKPHSVLADLHVHFAATAEFKDAEEDILRTFAANVSDDSRSRLPTGERVMPFANLRDGDSRRRNHGIAGATTGVVAKSTPTAPSMPMRGAPAPALTGTAARRWLQAEQFWEGDPPPGPDVRADLLRDGILAVAEAGPLPIVASFGRGGRGIRPPHPAGATSPEGGPDGHQYRCAAAGADDRAGADPPEG